MMLRSGLTQEWFTLLKKATNSYNETPIERLGWLKPNDISSPADSYKVDQSKLQHKIPIVKETTFEEKRENVKNYSGDLKIGDYVYKDFDQKLFDKSFDVSVKAKFTFVAIIDFCCKV